MLRPARRFSVRGNNKLNPGAVGVHIYIEFILALTILLAIYNTVRFYFAEGFLPIPFFDDAADTFMDWYNTVYWGYTSGAYNEWFSVYPPFSFVFMKFFSNPACYSETPFIGRACDPLGVLVLTSFAALNVVLVYLEYRKADSRTAWPRAVAVGLGASALFGLERGNVIICCFTFFILAHGRLLRSTWLRWICFGITVNLKPYLILMVAGRLIRRRWRWAEGCAIASVLIYAVSFVILGSGSPFELISNMFLFSGTPEHVTVYYLDYATTYNSMVEILKMQLPLMYYLGSKPIELVELIAPWLIKFADLGVLVCLVAAAFRPARLTSHRMAAMVMVLLLTNTKTLGGYAEVFLFYLVFFEKSEKVGLVVALLAAYLLSIPWDLMLVKIVHLETGSWLSGRWASTDFGLTLGAIVRPGLLLAIQFGLVAASLADIIRARPSKGEHPVRIPVAPLAPRLEGAPRLG